MMLELFGKAGSTVYHATIPFDGQFAFNFVRPSAERVSIVGNVIRQSATKDVSTGTASYSFWIPTSEADTLYDMDFALDDAYLSFNGQVFLVEFDAFVRDMTKNGKRLVDITFKVVSQII